MADDTSAALIAQLDVKFDQLASNMKKAMTVFDNGGRALEKRQAQIKKNLSNWTLDFTGLSGLNKALVGLTAVGVVGGLADLVKHGLDAASAIGDVAQQAGVSAEFLQKLRFAASQSGASFDIMDSALTTLNKTFGDFVNTGAGKGALAFKQLGIDKLINSGQIRDTEQLFDVLVQKISGFGSEAQKSSLLAAAFGKEAGPKLLQLVNQGAAGIADLEAKAVSLGIVLSTDTVRGAKEANDKLDALFSVIKAVGINAISSQAKELGNLVDQLSHGLPYLIQWVEKWAQLFGLIQLSPVENLKIQIADAQKDLYALQGQAADFKNSGFLTKSTSSFLSIFGAGKSDSEFSALISDQKAKIKSFQDELAHLPLTPFSGPFTLPASQPKLAVALTPAEIALAAKRKEELAKTGVDAATASAALIVAQDTTNVQLLKGSADYYAAVQKQINDEYQAKVTTAEAEATKSKATLAKKGTDWKGYADGVANINATLTDKIAAAAEEQKQKLDAAGPSSLIRAALIQGDKQIKQYGDETATIGLTAGAMASLAFMQNAENDAISQGLPKEAAYTKEMLDKAAAIGQVAQAASDAQEKIRDSIQVADEFRQGLIEVGATGLLNFNNLEDAATSFLNTMVDLIAQLYIMKPLVEGLFGQQGTSGLLGGFLSSLTGGSLASNTSAAIAANPLLFAGGGYTGPGGKNDLAGYVHKGEVVFSQDDVRRFGGVGVVESLRRGYANGGVVGMPTVSAPSLGGASSSKPVLVNIVLQNESDKSANASTSGGGPDIEVILDQIVARQVKRPGSQTNSALRNSFGLAPALTRR